jgi:integrase/recombinase XerD
MADKILRDACKRVKLEGVSTHSFRRTALTMMKERWYPLACYSGNIGTQRFRDFTARDLEVTLEQRRKAVAVIGF